MNYPTLSDLNSESLVPVIGGKKFSDFGKVAVLVSSDRDFKNIQSNLLKPEASSFYLSTFLTGRDGVCYAGPYIGSPYGAVLLESLIAKGISTILVLGWCGSISNKLKAGDLIIPFHAIADESISRNYVDIDDPFPVISPSVSLSESLGNKLDKMNIKFRKEKIWTTDAIFRETPKKVEFFSNKNASAVEMECSALFAVANYRKVEIASLLVVSDEIKSNESVREWIPGFRKKEFKEARKIACKAIAEYASELNQAKSKGDN